MIASNAKNNPTEPKYHSIKKSSNAFKNKIQILAPESEELLRAMGFLDTDPEVFAISGTPDGFTLGEAIKFIDLVLNKL